MPKRATLIVLNEKEQEGLLQITKRHRSEQQVVLRARIVLAAAQGHTNVQIARELEINVDTVRLWRDRWAGLQGIDLDVKAGGITSRFGIGRPVKRTPKNKIHERRRANAA
jgi:Homeodomain-like domain-containing protein